MDEIEELLNGLNPKSDESKFQADMQKLQPLNQDLSNMARTRERESEVALANQTLNLDKMTRSQAQDIMGNDLSNFATAAKDPYDRVRRASIYTGQVGEVLDINNQRKKFNQSEWTNSPFAALGYNDFLYVRAEEVEKKPEDQERQPFNQFGQLDLTNPNNTAFTPGAVTGFLQKFDDNQEYTFLVPAVDPNTGQDILREVRGTYEQVTKGGFNILNKYGAPDESDNLIVAGIKSFANTIGTTDDLIVGFSKFAQDAALFLPEKIIGEDIETRLDDIHEDTVKDTERTQFLLSDRTNDFGSAEWFVSGTSSGLASLLQFGWVGRGARAVGWGVEGLMGVAGRKVATNAVANKVATYGASGVIGFGYAYNEALQNGLTGGDALMYGTLVGAVNSAIELALGPSFDNYLTGGGPKQVAKEIMGELAEGVTEKSMKDWVANRMTGFVATVGSRFKNAASEGAEEVLQDVVEQGAKLAYNAAFTDKDTLAGQGKFDIREFDFTQTVAAGIFGAASALPFNSQTMTMAQRVMSGEAEVVRQSIETLYTDQKITLPVYNNLKTTLGKMEEAFNLNKNLLNGLTGDEADTVRAEAFQYINKRASLVAAQEALSKGLQDKPEASGEASDDFKALQVKIAELDGQIANYGNAEFLQKRVQEIKEAKSRDAENKGNVFAKISAQTNYKTSTTIEENKQRIGTLTAADFQGSPIVRTVEEANFTLQSLAGLDASIAPELGRQMRLMGWHNSPLVNTMANREALLATGLQLEEIPLTPEEKSDAVLNPQNYPGRYISPAEFNKLMSEAPGETNMSAVDMYKYVLTNAKQLGITPAMIHGLDNRSVLNDILTPEQMTAFTKLMDTSMPATIYIGNSDTGSATGVFADQYRSIYIDGIAARISQATGSKKAELQNHLFHVLTHELGHSLFNRDLMVLHKAWVKMATGQALSPAEARNGEFFRRLLALAQMTHDQLGQTPEAKGQYFFQIAQAWYKNPDNAARAAEALGLVREFYAEAMSNTQFQGLLDSVDLNDPKNKGLLDKYGYNYGKPEANTRETLLSQAFKAVASVFQRLGSILTRTDRTVLTETFLLGSNIDYNKFYVSTAEEARNANITTLTMSNYAGENIFQGEELDNDQMIAKLYQRLDKAGMRLDARAQKNLLTSIKAFSDANIYGTDKEVVGGSLLVVYFKATDNFMISWETVAQDGGRDYNRAFFNKYGDQRQVNSDVENKETPTTMSKPDAFIAFLPNAAGETGKENRNILNNLTRATAEGLEGNVRLELDQHHTWNFDGKNINGQIKLMYTFKDGSIGHIGYSHDLTKVRLAHLISNGTEINAKVSIAPGSKGSNAYTKRDAAGNFTEVRKTSDMTKFEASKNGYTLERVFPIMEFRYTNTVVPAQAALIASKVDTVTPDNKSVKPKVTKADLATGAELIRSGYFTKDIFPSFSFYAPEEGKFNAGSIDSRIQYLRDGLPRFVRRCAYFQPHGQEFVINDLIEFANLYKSKAADEILKSIPEEMQESASIFGFESEDQADQFVAEEIEKIMREYKNAGNIAQEDWSGMGGNPSGRISAGIKADIEALSFEYGNGKFWVDFGDAKDILFENSKGTSDFAGIVKNIEGSIKKQVYAGKRLAIANSLVKHLTKAGDLDPVKNSYWSQFASYVRLDAITFGVSEDGTMRMYFNGEKSQLDRTSKAYASQIQARMNEAMDAVIARGEAATETSVMNEISSRINAHFVDQETERLMNRKIYATEAEARAAAESFLLTAEGKSVSTVAKKIISFKSRFNKRSMFNMLGYSDQGVMTQLGQLFFKQFNVKPNNGKALEDYQKHADMTQSFLSYFGIELPTSMFTVDRDTKGLQDLLQGYNNQLQMGVPESDALRNIQAAMKSTPINKYFTVAYKPEGSDRVDEYPFMMFAPQLVDYIDKNMKRQASGAKFKYNMGEMDILAKASMQMNGTYRSPEFYFNAKFDKEWAMKTRSYIDTLVETLSNEDSGLLSKYQSSDLYRGNRFLQTIKKYKGQPMQVMLSGIKAIGDNPNGKSYNDSGDLDFLYMSIAGFVHNYYSDTYYHIDDVPSDKPRNSVFRIARFAQGNLKGEISNIIASEKFRFKNAGERFDEAFDVVDDLIDGKAYYKVTNQAAFDKLVPGVHYGKAITKDGIKLYPAGWIFNRENYFYGGKDVDSVAAEISADATSAYNEMAKQGLNIPVPVEFVNDLNEKNISGREREIAMKSEQRRIFEEWFVNSTINRYHINQVLMGDYIYYKPDAFSDLNKRHAGAVAPSAKGVHAQPTMKVVYLNDIEDKDLLLPKTKLDPETNTWKIDDSVDPTKIDSNRTDAQGYATEQFAAQMIDAYGSFSGYEKVFKPVVYGVNQSSIADGQPIYLKLSLAVLPDPSKAENDTYYATYPEQKELALKVYASGAQFAVFNSGIKVGANTMNSISDNDFKTSEIDSNLFGLQNNPYHDPNSDSNYLSGMVQQTKQLGDNGNFDIMQVYHDIESKMVDAEVRSYLERSMGSLDDIRESVKRNLERNAYSAPIADFIDSEMRVLDNPVTMKNAENMINAQYRDAVALYPKDGEKLVNVSDLGFSRPVIEGEEEQRAEILNRMGIEATPYNRELRWMGPRTAQELTLTQLMKLEQELTDGQADFDKNMNILDADGNLKIYPTEVLVPQGPNYQLGDRVIATRIPTSKKSSSIPGEVVGFLHPNQGNLIVVGKQGPGVLGFDFDVDGLFVWRERQRTPNHGIRKMFEAGFKILTRPSNYNEMTSPTVTDNVAKIAAEIDALLGSRKKSYNKFSPMRQIELKKLNSIGKVMIGVSALASGIHSVLQQNNGSEFNQTDNNVRGYLLDGTDESDYNLKTKFEQIVQDSRDGEFLVTDIYSEFINAATDNAKLQLLGRLNMNPVTASVAFDMISHGASMRYAMLFINQPAIRELVRLTENESSASHIGEKGDTLNRLMRVLEDEIKNIPGYEQYSFAPRDAQGYTVEGSKSIGYVTKGPMGFGHRVISQDKVKLTTNSLENGIRRKTDSTMNTPEQNRFTLLEQQLVVLDKFRYYKSLAQATANAGKLVTLTSTYPKTYIEALDTATKITAAIVGETIGVDDEGNDIKSTPAIDITGLVENHGMYKVHRNRLKDLLYKYGQFKLYAQPAIRNMHQALAKGKSVDIQTRLQDDFYTYILSLENESDNANFLYNLTTSSLTGQEIDPYHFVNTSALVIEELKRQYPTNEFLRILNVKINPNPRETDNKAGKPSQVTADLSVDPDGDMLERIRQGFLALPADFVTNQYQIIDGEKHMVETTIKSTQDLLLGHLLYTQGFGMGGFSFSKMLPVGTVKFFDSASQVVEDALNSYMELNPSDQLINQEEVDKYFAAARNDANLNNFVKQAKMNIPELIREFNQLALDKVFATDRSHFEKWGKQENRPGADYKGLRSTLTLADGGESVVIQRDANNIDNVRFFDHISKEGMVRMKDLNGKVRVYELVNGGKKEVQASNGKSYKVMFAELKTVNFLNHSNLKQYGSLYFNKSSNSNIEKGLYEAIPVHMPIEPMSNEEIGITPVSSATPAVPSSDYVDLEAIKAGAQTAALFQADPNLRLNQVFLIPGENGSAMARVKSIWDFNQMYSRALSRNTGDETAKMLAWASKVMDDNFTNIGELLDKFVVEFEYLGTTDANGEVTSQAGEMFGDKGERINPNTFSEYNPKRAQGLYKSLMVKAGTSLVPVQELTWTKSGDKMFFDLLAANHVDAIQRQIINDYIKNTSPESITTVEISNALIGMGEGDFDLENYQTSVGYDRNTDSPLEVMYDVANSVLAAFDAAADDFMSYMDQPMNGEDEMINPDTMQPYTYYEWLTMHYDKYIREVRVMDELVDKFEKDTTSFTLDELADAYALIRQGMGAANGLIWKKYNGFIQKLGGAIGVLAEGKSINMAMANGNTKIENQRDISGWMVGLTAITDFSERQAAMQEVGRQVAVAAGEANAEKLRTKATTDRLMHEVLKYTFPDKSESWISKLNPRKKSAAMRNVFDWMLERDKNGEYTGKLIPRYKENEKELRDQIFERAFDPKGNPRFYVIPNKDVLAFLLESSAALTSNENRMVKEIFDKYNGYEHFFTTWEQMSEEQRFQSGRDTSIIRNLWIKAKLKEYDSSYFVDLKKQAQVDNVTGKLAAAKIALYDYLYDRSNDLLAETGYFAYPLERGLMPQTEADFNETWSRYGFGEAKRRFLDENQSEADNLETLHGITISTNPIIGFQSSKKVPFRTLKNKKNFSVNVPAIFEHHFNSLIFKKHYDKVLPFMDAIQVHYQMRQNMGEGSYANLQEFITEYANQRIFYKKTDLKKTKPAKIIGLLSSLTVTMFLGLAPMTSIVNWSVGNLETWKQFIGDYGFGEGSRKMRKGFSRIYSPDISGGKPTLISKKGLAIMERYGITTFTESELKDKGNYFGKVQDAMLTLQTSGEIAIRGAALLAEFSDAQWNAFSINENGELIEDKANAPTELQVAEWKNKIGSAQGKYDDESKRLYHGSLIYQQAFLFKGWLTDYVRNRAGSHIVDQFGNEREGYYRTGLRMLFGSENTNGEKSWNAIRYLEYLKGKKTLTELEQQNLRKVYFDVLAKVALYMLATLAGGDDESENSNNWYIRSLSKISSSLFLMSRPDEVLKMVKQPFAALHIIEQAAKLVDSGIDMDAEGAFNAGYSLLPGKQVIQMGSDAIDLVTDGEDEDTE